jgi:hypothetical protein
MTEITPEMRVIITIYQESMKGEKVCYTSLKKILQNKVTDEELRRTLQKNYDLGMLDAKWEKIGTAWCRTVTVSEELEYLVIAWMKKFPDEEKPKCRHTDGAFIDSYFQFSEKEIECTNCGTKWIRKYSNKEVKTMMSEGLKEMFNDPKIAEECERMAREMGRINPEDMQRPFDI